MTSATHGPRVAALVGPYQSGKTSLLESLLLACGAVHRKGSLKDGTTVGDFCPEARAKQMSAEATVATTTYLDEEWTFIDCPGAVELSQGARDALMVADVAVVVCESDPDKALSMEPLLRYLDERNIPHLLFINKMDQRTASVRAMMEALQGHSARPLVLREIPIREGGQVTGHIDLVSERAFHWEDGKPSTLMELPDDARAQEESAREEMLETLADFDDTLMEELLEDVAPSTEEVYDTLARDLGDDKVVPVFFGTAEQDHGINRLLKALRHEAPGVAETAQRLGVADGSGLLAQVFLTRHGGHAGKMSIARIWRGGLTDATPLGGVRPAGLAHLLGDKAAKATKALAGQVVALNKMEQVQTGDALSDEGDAVGVVWPAPLRPLYGLALHPADNTDDVKLTEALNRLTDEDPALKLETNPVTGELVLWGQGELHLDLAHRKLEDRSGLSVAKQRPKTAYQETIRKPAANRARHKKQSGGHGEFADVEIKVQPLPRGEGYAFTDSIHGGSVPRNYIPAVESGVKEQMARGGPKGHPVVDVAVELLDGQHHAVDSSDMAFKKAAAQALRSALNDAGPVVLEPVCRVEVSAPNQFTSNLQRVVSARRGQILAFQPRDGWQGWDTVVANLPQAEMHDLIIDLRSQTQGLGTFEWSFDHMQET